jgi:hypothetical protein
MMVIPEGGLVESFQPEAVASAVSPKGREKRSENAAS